MKYFGIGLSHESGYVLLNDAGEIEEAQTVERITGIKHANLSKHARIMPPWARGVHEHIADILRREKEIVVVDTSWTGFDYSMYPGFTPITEDIVDLTKTYAARQHYTVSHHLCHIASSIMFRSFPLKDVFFMIWDGRGWRINGDTICSMSGYVSEDKLQVLEYNPLPSVFCLVQLLGPNSAGKAMGLYSYLQYVGEFSREEIAELKTPVTGRKGRKGNREISPRYLEYVSSFYKTHIDKIWVAMEQQMQKYDYSNGILVGGGGSLALELNTKLCEKCDGKFVFSPAATDSGLALGAAAIGYFLVNKRWPPPLSNAFLHTPQTPNPPYGPQTIPEIVDLLMEGKAIGLIRGDWSACIRP